MKILITGAKGFIGRNLIEALGNKNNPEFLQYDKGSDPQTLQHYTRLCDFVFHFAAVHRPADGSEFGKINHLFFSDILELLRSNNNNCPVLLPSSIQAGDDSLYGKSKLAAEQALKAHADLMNSRAIIYRLTNTFGKYAEPNHHSVVATFCYNIARGLPIVISDPNHIMNFYYIDDVTDSFIAQIKSYIEPDPDGFYRLPEKLKYTITLKELADNIYKFKYCFDKGTVPGCSDQFTVKLYKTYLSYHLDCEANEGALKE